MEIRKNSEGEDISDHSHFPRNDKLLKKQNNVQENPSFI